MPSIAWCLQRLFEDVKEQKGTFFIQTHFACKKKDQKQVQFKEKEKQSFVSLHACKRLAVEQCGPSRFLDVSSTILRGTKFLLFLIRCKWIQKHYSSVKCAE